MSQKKTGANLVSNIELILSRAELTSYCKYKFCNAFTVKRLDKDTNPIQAIIIGTLMMPNFNYSK